MKIIIENMKEMRISISSNGVNSPVKHILKCWCNVLKNHSKSMEELTRWWWTIAKERSKTLEHCPNASLVVSCTKDGQGSRSSFCLMWRLSHKTPSSLAKNPKGYILRVKVNTIGLQLEALESLYSRTQGARDRVSVSKTTNIGTAHSLDWIKVISSHSHLFREEKPNRNRPRNDPDIGASP